MSRHYSVSQHEISEIIEGFCELKSAYFENFSQIQELQNHLEIQQSSLAQYQQLGQNLFPSPEMLAQFNQLQHQEAESKFILLSKQREKSSLREDILQRSELTDQLRPYISEILAFEISKATTDQFGNFKEKDLEFIAQLSIKSNYEEAALQECQNIGKEDLYLQLQSTIEEFKAPQETDLDELSEYLSDLSSSPRRPQAQSVSPQRPFSRESFS